MKKKVILLVILALVAIGAFFAYNYAYQDHRSIDQEEAVFTGTSELLESNYLEDNNALLNKTVAVNGTITQIEENSITLDEKINCSFLSLPEGMSVGQTVSVKARCIGYDDLFELVKLDQSTLTNL